MVGRIDKGQRDAHESEVFEALETRHGVLIKPAMAGDPTCLCGNSILYRGILGID